MKALFISHNVNMSGANKSFISIIKKLYKEMDITVLVNSKEGKLVDELKVLGVLCKYCKYDWWFAHSRENCIKQIVRYAIDEKKYRLSKISRQFIEELKNEKYDLVYTNTSTVDVGAKIAKLLRIPHVWHVREFGKEDFGFIPLTFNQYRENTFNKATAIILISKALKRKYSQFVPIEKLSVVYNGFEIDKLCSSVCPHDLKKRINILITGQVSAAKGQDTAIRAIYRLKKQGYPVRLFIAGNIDYSYINPILNSLPEPYDKWCKLLGPVENIYNLRNNMDIELVCSKSEAFGRVTLEAMLHSIPVIASKTGGSPELIRHNETGMLFEYGNDKQLAENIVYLINNEEQYFNIIQKAYSYAKTFTIDQTVDGIRKIFEKVVGY